MASGIYRIDGPNGKYYVGSAKDISKRWAGHRRDLRSCRHASQKLQCAWTHHGEDAFRFSVIEIVEDLAMLIPREQYWIDTLDAVAKGYNVLITAGSRLGVKHSEETRKKQSAAHTGRKHGPMSEEQKAYYSNLYRGKKLSEETRKRMSESRTGRKYSEAHRAKLSEGMKGISKTA